MMSLVGALLLLLLSISLSWCGVVQGIQGNSRFLSRVARSTDACNPNPCQNGRDCTLNATQPSGYTCDCNDMFNVTSEGRTKTIVTGWIGVNCTTPINVCSHSPCFNGLCSWDAASANWSCTCNTSYIGKYCHLVDQCNKTHPTYNVTRLPVCVRGNCSMPTSSSRPFECTCPSGYTGLRCENNINECLSKPCRNNGTCFDLDGSFNCTCHPGYQGDTCQEDINDCQPNPCDTGTECLQRSNQRLYGSSGLRHLPPFNGPFSFQNASGFVCRCLPDTPMIFGFNGNNSYVEYNLRPSLRDKMFASGNFSIKIELVTRLINSSANDNLLLYFGYVSNFTYNSTRDNGYLMIFLTPKGQLKVLLRYHHYNAGIKSNQQEFIETYENFHLADGKQRYLFLIIQAGRTTTLTVEVPGLGKQTKNINSKFSPLIFLGNADVLYIGGYPGSLTPPSRSGSARVSAHPLPAEATSVTPNGFKGAIYNVTIGRNILLKFLQCDWPTNFDTINVYHRVGMTAGKHTEDICLVSRPCKNGGTCTNVFYNTYRCTCNSQWRGETCKYRNYCARDDVCPKGYKCMNMKQIHAYECRGSLKFTRLEPSVNFRPTAVGHIDGVDVSTVSVRIRTRYQSTETLLTLFRKGDTKVGEVKLLSNRSLHATGIVGSTTLSSLSEFRINDGQWNHFQIKWMRDKIEFKLLGAEDVAEITKGENGLEKVTKITLFPRKERNLVGCILSIKVNGFPFRLHLHDGSDSEGGGPKWRALLSADTYELFKNNNGSCIADQVCSPNPCRNGGVCVDKWNAYECRCSRGYKGSNCTIPYCPGPLNTNTDHPLCQNGGTCKVQTDQFKCTCIPGYLGHRCATVDPCNNGTCKNGGICTPIILNDGNTTESTDVKIKCSCFGDWTGPYCDKKNIHVGFAIALTFDVLLLVITIILIVIIIFLVRRNGRLPGVLGRIMSVCERRTPEPSKDVSMTSLRRSESSSSSVPSPQGGTLVMPKPTPHTDPVKRPPQGGTLEKPKPTPHTDPANRPPMPVPKPGTAGKPKPPKKPGDCLPAVSMPATPAPPNPYSEGPAPKDPAEGDLQTDMYSDVGPGPIESIVQSRGSDNTDENDEVEGIYYNEMI